MTINRVPLRIFVASSKVQRCRFSPFVSSFALDILPNTVPSFSQPCISHGARCLSGHRTQSGNKALSSSEKYATSESWSEEWRALGLGARLTRPNSRLTNLLFVQMGFGVDQHGDRTLSGATKAAVRAVRNAIEFNSIPGVIESVPGGRKEMLVRVKLGVPPDNDGKPMEVDLKEVAKVFPYGRLMPMEIVVGGLAFSTGRVVEELGDTNDEAVCVAACVSIGYDDGSRETSRNGGSQIVGTEHKTYSTKDGH